MAKRTEVVLAGTAGQGLVFAGVVLADAAGIAENKFVSHLGFYSINARTGPSRSEVIIGDEEIDYPAATEPDIVVAFTKEDAQRYASAMRKDGTLIMEDAQIDTKNSASLSIHKLPFLTIARKELGEELIGNLVALGALATITGVISPASLEKTLAAKSKGEALQRNLAALRLGCKLAASR